MGKTQTTKYPSCNKETGWPEIDDCVACGKLIRLSSGSLNCSRGRVWGARGDNSWKIKNQVDILFLGESPGEDEAKVGDYFVGRAGKKLKEWLDIHRLQDSSLCIYFDNAIRCSLYDDISKLPTVNKKTLVNNCKYWLSKEIKRLNPKVIVTLGNVGLQALTGITGITRWYGRVLIHPEARCYIIPAFHPAGVLRGNRDDWEEYSLESIKKAIQYTKKSIKFSNIETIFVRDEQQLNDCISDLSQYRRVVVDLETHGADAWTGAENIIGMSLCSHKNKAYFIPFMKWENTIDGDVWKLGKIFIQKKWLNKIYKLLADKRRLKIFHNAGFDLLWLKQLGWDLWPIYDTIIVNSVLDDIDNGLKDLAWMYTDFAGYEDEMWSFLKSSKDSFTKVPPDLLARYGAMDGIATFRLYEYQTKILKTHATAELVEQLNNLRYYLTNMEYTGCLLDLNWVDNLKADYLNKLDGFVSEIRKGVKNNELNPNSPVQMLDAFFGPNGLFSLKEVGLDKATTDKSALNKIVNVYKKKKTKIAKQKLSIVQNFIYYRKDSKKLSTYIENFKNNNIDGRMHPWFKVYSTKTGRMSSNLQQVPRGDEIRGCFVAGEGKTLVEYDYSQLEIRISGQYCQDDDFCDVLNSGEDIHSYIGQSAIKKSDGSDYPLEEFKSGEKRAQAKGISFSVLYGKTIEGLAEVLGVTLEDAARIQTSFFNRFPGLKKWIDRQHAHALTNRSVTTLFGRVLQFTGFDFKNMADRSAVCRRAVNWPIQSSASDCVIYGLNRVETTIKKCKMPVKSILTVHDSIMYEVESSFVDYFLPVAKKNLEEQIPQIDMIKLFVDCKVGDRWGDMKSVEIK